MNARIALVAVLAAACLTGCASNKAASADAPKPAAAGMLNSKCPISGEPIDGKTAIDYKGGKVGFCCAGCIGEFKKESADQQAKQLEKAK